MDRSSSGALAEGVAARYLEGNGYEILARNYRKPWGEIDIIAQKEGVVVFVEVKANTKAFVGDFNPEIRVDRTKLNKITKTATLYLGYELKRLDSPWRVDIISVVIDEDERRANVKHFKNVAEAWF